MEKQYRLKNWDYSNSGYYFVTICTQDRTNLFRKFKNNPHVGTDPSFYSPVGTDPCVCSFNKNVCSSLNNNHSFPNNIVMNIPSTVCSFNKNTQTLGEINTIGQMIEKWWLKIPQKFPAIILDEFIIMPNHFHGILIIKNDFNNKEQTHGSVPTGE